MVFPAGLMDPLCPAPEPLCLPRHHPRCHRSVCSVHKTLFHRRWDPNLQSWGPVLSIGHLSCETSMGSISGAVLPDGRIDVFYVHFYYVQVCQVRDLRRLTCR